MSNHFNGLISVEDNDSGTISAKLTELGQKTIYENFDLNELVAFAKGLCGCFKIEVKYNLNGNMVSDSKEFLAYHVLTNSIVESIFELTKDKDKEHSKFDFISKDEKMWSKNKPKREGYYWVKASGQLTGKDYVHPVHVYSSKKNEIVDTVFSDGENFSVDSDMFVEWYSEQIAMPAQIFGE